MVLEDGMLPNKPFHVDWFYKLPGDIQKTYPKTLARLGGTVQKNPAKKFKCRCCKKTPEIRRA